MGIFNLGKRSGPGSGSKNQWKNYSIDLEDEDEAIFKDTSHQPMLQHGRQRGSGMRFLRLGDEGETEPPQYEAPSHLVFPTLTPPPESPPPLPSSSGSMNNTFTTSTTTPTTTPTPLSSGKKKKKKKKNTSSKKIPSKMKLESVVEEIGKTFSDETQSSSSASRPRPGVNGGKPTSHPKQSTPARNNPAEESRESGLHQTSDTTNSHKEENSSIKPDPILYPVSDAISFSKNFLEEESANTSSNKVVDPFGEPDSFDRGNFIEIIAKDSEDDAQKHPTSENKQRSSRKQPKSDRQQRDSDRQHNDAWGFSEQISQNENDGFGFERNVFRDNDDGITQSMQVKFESKSTDAFGDKENVGSSKKKEHSSKKQKNSRQSKAEDSFAEKEIVESLKKNHSSKKNVKQSHDEWGLLNDGFEFNDFANKNQSTASEKGEKMSAAKKQSRWEAKEPSLQWDFSDQQSPLNENSFAQDVFKPDSHDDFFESPGINNRQLFYEENKDADDHNHRHLPKEDSFRRKMSPRKETSSQERAKLDLNDDWFGNDGDETNQAPSSKHEESHAMEGNNRWSVHEASSSQFDQTGWPDEEIMSPPDFHKKDSFSSEPRHRPKKESFSSEPRHRPKKDSFSSEPRRRPKKESVSSEPRRRPSAFAENVFETESFHMNEQDHNRKSDIKNGRSAQRPSSKPKSTDASENELQNSTVFDGQKDGRGRSARRRRGDELLSKKSQKKEKNVEIDEHKDEVDEENTQWRTKNGVKDSNIGAPGAPEEEADVPKDRNAPGSGRKINGPPPKDKSLLPASGFVNSMASKYSDGSPGASNPRYRHSDQFPRSGSKDDVKDHPKSQTGLDTQKKRRTLNPDFKENLAVRDEDNEKTQTPTNNDEVAQLYREFKSQLREKSPQISKPRTHSSPPKKHESSQAENVGRLKKKKMAPFEKGDLKKVWTDQEDKELKKSESDGTSGTSVSSLSSSVHHSRAKSMQHDEHGTNKSRVSHGVPETNYGRSSHVLPDKANDDSGRASPSRHRSNRSKHNKYSSPQSHCTGSTAPSSAADTSQSASTKPDVGSTKRGRGSQVATEQNNDNNSANTGPSAGSGSNKSGLSAKKRAHQLDLTSPPRPSGLPPNSIRASMLFRALDPKETDTVESKRSEKTSMVPYMHPKQNPKKSISFDPTFLEDSELLEMEEASFKGEIDTVPSNIHAFDCAASMVSSVTEHSCSFDEWRKQSTGLLDLLNHKAKLQMEASMKENAKLHEA